MDDQMTRGNKTAGKRLVGPAHVLFVMFGAIMLTLASPLNGFVTPARADSMSSDMDIRLPDNDLIEAARKGDVAGVDQALRTGLSPDDTGIGHVPAIIVAADNNHMNVLKLLLEKGANPNRQAADGRTALSVAAQAGRDRMVSTLLDHAADPNILVDHGDTALIVAVRAHRTTIVRMLLEHKADISDTDVTGRTILDLAEERHFDDIVQMLRKAGA